MNRLINSDDSAVTIDDRYTWYINENIIIDQEHGSPVDLASLPGATSNAAKRALRLIYENIILPKHTQEISLNPSNHISHSSVRHEPMSNTASPATCAPQQPTTRSARARATSFTPQAALEFPLKTSGRLISQAQRVDSSPKRARTGVLTHASSAQNDTILGLHADTSGFSSNNTHQIILSDGTVHKSMNAANKGNLLRFKRTGNLLFAIPPEPSLAEFYQWKSELLENITTPDRQSMGDYRDICRRLEEMLRNDGRPAVLYENLICNFTLIGMSSNNLSLLLVCADGSSKELRMFGSAHALFYKCFQRVDFDPGTIDQYKIELDGMFTLKRDYNPQFKMGTIKFLETPQWKVLMSRKSKFGE